MGIELPPELADVAAQAGVAWPEADEEAMTRAAKAWRDAAADMDTVTTDADTTVRSALDAVKGDAGTAAAQHWSAFVEPDSGHLTATVRGMNDAADRLDHAAQQVGTAKVEIVRNLVSLAQNSDAAHSAASAGHPMALAGLETAVRGTSANVANIESNLIDAVRPGSVVDMAAVEAPVNASPGAHGPGPQDMVGTLAATVDSTLDDTGGVVSDTVGDVRGAVAPGQALVDDTVGGAVAPGHEGGLVGDTVGGVRGAVDDVVGGTVGQGPGGAPGLGHGDPDVTGPVPIRPDLPPGAQDVLPGDARPGYWPPDDRPTPPTGTTVQAGFDSAPAAPANLPPGAPPLSGAPAPGGGQPGGVPGFGGGPSVGASPGGPVGGMGPAPGGPAAGAAAAAGAAGARPADRSIGRPSDVGRPSDAAVEPRTRSGAPAQPAPARPVNQPGPVSQPGGPGSPAQPAPGKSNPPGGPAQPGPVQGKSSPPAGPAHPGPPPGKPGVQANIAQPGQAALGQPGAPRPGQPSQVAAGQYDPTQDPGQPVVRERDEVLALFWVHMFPIGHMPVAADRPARQVPPPREELDYAAGIRFEPGDHPRTDLVDSVDRCAALRDGAPFVSSSEPLTRDDLAELTEGHDPLGGENERDWDRRYQVRFGSVTAEGIRPDGLEFAWPPGEQYPEGGSADGEAEVLDEGAEIDRFGTTAGRVFAEAGTRFAQRSLPPSHLDLGYRRYRVLRPLPVWRAVSAAWFAQPGGGVRYRTTHSAIELVALGYLADITREEP